MQVNQLHIVLAEDDIDDRMFFKQAFDDLKIDNTLIMFEDGFQLMDHLKHTPVLPHIIFLDLNMPGKSGIQCLKDIRANPLLKNITVSIYSSQASESNIEQTFIAGANVFIKKPNDFNQLKKILTEVNYINWQYIIDDISKENFMLNY